MTSRNSLGKEREALVSFNSSEVYLSSIDEERFGIRTARALLVTLDKLPSVIDFCRANYVVLLIARCLASELRVAHAMEREGFLLMDSLVYYACNLSKTPIPSDISRVSIRPIRHGEEDAVKVVASEAFRGYFGHYHADDRLDPVKCDEVYPFWAERSTISCDDAHEVLVADLEDTIVGFSALRLNNKEEGECVLSGVLPAAQGRGVYRSLKVDCMEWCLSKGAIRLISSTQITNIAVQKVWTRLGFEPSHAYYTFHKWFDRR